MDTNPNSSDNHSPDSASPPPRSIDWAAIHLVYTTTSNSTRDIGRAHGVTHAAIGKRARREGWERPEKEKQVSAKLAKLEPRQQRFVQEYLVDLNGTQAYIRTVPGTPERTAQTMASRLLGKVEVQAAITAERAKTSATLGLTRERVLAEYAKLAFFDMRQAYHESGALKMPHELDEDAAAAIAAYETVEMNGGDKDSPPLLVRKVKWFDRKAALDSIMKAQGWNKSDVGTSENPLVIRGMTDAERAVRMSSLLQANPALVATLAQLMAAGAQQ